MHYCIYKRQCITLLSTNYSLQEFLTAELRTLTKEEPGCLFGLLLLPPMRLLQLQQWAEASCSLEHILK